MITLKLPAYSKSGDVLEGIAIDIQLNERKQECIKISSGKTSTLVILDTISSMESQIENPHFKKLNFE